MLARSRQDLSSQVPRFLSFFSLHTTFTLKYTNMDKILKCLMATGAIMGGVHPWYEKSEVATHARWEREAREKAERKIRAQAWVLSGKGTLEAIRSEGAFRHSSSARRACPSWRGPTSVGR